MPPVTTATPPLPDSTSGSVDLALEDHRLRKAIAGSYFCPYTQNKKFETFIRDLLELDLPNWRTKEEIVQFVSLIETFYCDKIANLIHKERQTERSLKR